MSAPNDGGPAFPWDDKNGDGSHYQAYPGMSLRDWFAGMALNQCLRELWGEGEGTEGIATAAYQMADAMLKAREAKE